MSEWISVTDELPRIEDGHYYSDTVWALDGVYPSLAVWNRYNTWQDRESCDGDGDMETLYNVTHWQRLVIPEATP